VIGVGGFSSDTGKTTLMCDLLRAFPGWEAIKTTRGHYRSCGKDPHTCCVSDLLEEEPVVQSGYEQTFAAGKDTGRYWEAGAANVHWLIATDSQVEAGIKQALSLVRAAGVFVEGNSFSEFVPVDAMILTVRQSRSQIKRSAKEALGRANALYLWADVNPQDSNREILGSVLNSNDDLLPLALNVPSYTSATFPDLVAQLQRLNERVAA
jgi:molybdopterin-guanine dinucleotide biosynthesis protein